MATKHETIRQCALQILERHPEGIRYSELKRKIHEQFPDFSVNTIDGGVWDLDRRLTEVVKPERGLFILRKYLDEGAGTVPKESKSVVASIPETDFYAPFADYLVRDLGECTKAIPLGGNKFGDKWGTPDVFGVYKFSEADPIRPPIEIISAEVKADTNQLVTAFGQACSYKLFSHKVYLVVPKDAERDIARIEALCFRFGIGLILFDRNNAEEPGFGIRTRAMKSEPDYFYVNECLRRLGEDCKKLF